MLSVDAGNWTSLSEWVQALPDPHEFATSLVNWAEENPDKRNDMFVLFNAFDYWFSCETLEGFTG